MNIKVFVEFIVSQRGWCCN